MTTRPLTAGGVRTRLAGAAWLAMSALLTVAPVAPAWAVAGSWPAAAPGAVAAPAGFTLRFSSQGWADILQAGAAQLTCGADPGCTMAAEVAGYTDVDSDQSTVNSSRATVPVPPGSRVDWAGLYWAGDLASRPDGAPPRCEAADPAAAPATPPPNPAKNNQVRVAINGAAYAAVTASAVSPVAGPGGGPGFQAYADVTAMVRAAPAPVTLTVADLQIAQGAGCGGGWTVAVAYSYPDGPDRTYAPDYRTVAIYDGVVPAPAGAAQPVALSGLTLPAAGPVSARLSSALLASGQALAPTGLSLGNTAVPLAGTGTTGVAGVPGPGYHQARSTLAPAALTAGANAATAAITTARDGFVAGVLGLSTALPVTVNLALTAALDPPTVNVGDDATLTVSLKNPSDLPDTGVTVTTHLPPGLTVLSAPAGFDTGSGLWTVGKVGPHATATLPLLVRVTAAGSMQAGFDISASDLPDPTPAPGTVSILAQPSPTAGPTDDPDLPPPAVAAAGWSWPSLPPGIYFGIGIFALGLFALSLVVIRLRRT